MTTSNYKKVFKQLKVKPPKLEKFIKHNSPKKRSCGVALRKCSRCGRIGGHVGKYGLDLCRQCFRDIAVKLGFKKFN
jgi:small subunit ribosomal protein S14